MTDASLGNLLAAAADDARVLAVLLYGSRARGEARPDSDTDVCVVLSPEAAAGDSAQAQFDFLEFADLDVRIFQRLPVYVRQRILKEGKPLLVKDEDSLYEIAFRTIRDFEDFEPFYREYLKEIANG